MNGSAPQRVRLADAHWNARLVVGYAEVIGLLDPSAGPGMSVGRFNDALRALAGAGVARHVELVAQQPTEGELGRAAGAALAAIEESPLPTSEWRALDGVLANMLPGLLGVSMSSVSRYRAGTRATPDAVAARLHTLALIVTDLAGSYNEFGIRRWFQRPRTALDGRAPRDILSGRWDTGAPDVGRVRELAASLTRPAGAL